MRRRVLILTALAAVAGAPARAESPVGVWRYDIAAMEAEAERFAQAMAARLAPQIRAMTDRLPRMEQQVTEQRKRAGKDPAKLAQVEQLERAVARMRAMVTDPARYYKALILDYYSDDRVTLEFKPDGRVVTTDPRLPEPAEGRWQPDGDGVRLTLQAPTFGEAGFGVGPGPGKGTGKASDPGRSLVMRGTFEGGRLSLGWTTPPVGATEDPGLASMLGEMRVHLVRR